MVPRQAYNLPLQNSLHAHYPQPSTSSQSQVQHVQQVPSAVQQIQQVPQVHPNHNHQSHSSHQGQQAQQVSAVPSQRPTPIAVQSPTRSSHHQPPLDPQDAATLEESYKRTIIIVYWYKVRMLICQVLHKY